jgi:hypothetical protein
MRANPFSEGLARVLIEALPKSNRGYGFIDRTGRVVVTPQYDQLAKIFLMVLLGFCLTKNGATLIGLAR